MKWANRWYKKLVASGYDFFYCVPSTQLCAPITLLRQSESGRETE